MPCLDAIAVNGINVSIHFHIIGLGVSQTALLSSEAERGLKKSSAVLGSHRQLDVVERYLSDQITYEFPKFAELPNWIEEQKALGVKDVAILGSGDPLFFGIGRWFSRYFAEEQLSFYPAVSSIQAACHKLGLSLQDCKVISLHGRPLETLRASLKQNQTLLVLTDIHSSPPALARECKDMGFGSAKISVCEKLGYDDECIRTYFANDEAIDEALFDPLHVSVIETGSSKVFVPEFPGIPDTEFYTDGPSGKGMLTKREVRLSILSLLQPSRGDVIWDIGAGCGSVAVELALWQQQHQVFAIEHHQERLPCLKKNQDKFGVQQSLKIIEGRAPEALKGLDNPTKIFIGGSDGELSRLFSDCWALLPKGGVLLASAVTEQTKHTLIDQVFTRKAVKDTHFESVQIAVSRSSELAGQLMYRPNLPVTLFKWVKQ